MEPLKSFELTKMVPADSTAASLATALPGSMFYLNFPNHPNVTFILGEVFCANCMMAIQELENLHKERLSAVDKLERAVAAEMINNVKGEFCGITRN